MQEVVYPAIERDMEVNRRLCLYLMRRMAAALRQVDQYQAHASEDALLPTWATLLFGSKEGLMASYIKLSQQHLKIAQMQVELLEQRRKEAKDAITPEAEAAELSDEEIAWVKDWLQRQTESGAGDAF